MTDGAGIGTRREAREDALAILYEMELTGDPVGTSLNRRDVPPDDYAIAMIEGVSSRGSELDELLGRYVRRWRVERLTVVDRTLARMAAWELTERDDVPTGVILSELVELATQYSGSEAPRFLNGVLRAVADELRS